MKNVYLFQPQYEIVVGDEINYWIPYSIGCLWSYVYQYTDIQESYKLKKLFYKRDSTETVLSTLENPSVVGFSCYTWNEQYCLGVAKKIKEKWPDCYVIFGGAQSSGSLIKHDFIDSIVLAEGEESFLEILRCLNTGVQPDTFYNKKRLDNLDIPSPYLTGVFDDLIIENPQALWAATIETNRGCPYACTFCDWGGTTYSKIKKFNLERIHQELEWVKNHRVVYLFGADANFGIFKDRDLEIAKMIKHIADGSMIEAVNLQYAKNNTDTVFEIGKILGNYNRGITVSVQSMHTPTLEAIKRTNLEINDLSEILKLSEQYSMSTYTEIILGLPLETVETWKDGITELLELGQHQSIDLSFTELLENSELNKIEQRNKYGITSINVEHYYNTFVDTEYPETATIVNSTSTMSTDEMVLSYIYAWMIIHFHINGYTQIFARYLRSIKGVSYRKYYDCVFENLKNDAVFGKHYSQLSKTLYHYLTTGKLKYNENFYERGYSFHFASHEFCYNNKESIFEIGKTAFKEFYHAVEPIEHVQIKSIFDIEQTFPMSVELDFSINTWQETKTSYTLTNSIDISNKKKVDFWALRRKNLLKNKFNLKNETGI